MQQKESISGLRFKPSSSPPLSAPFLYSLLLSLVVVLCFSNSLPNGFVFDDLSAILKNPDVTDCLLPPPSTKDPDVIGDFMEMGGGGEGREVEGKEKEKEGGRGKRKTKWNGRIIEEEEKTQKSEKEAEDDEEEEESHWMNVFKHDFWGTDINSVRFTFSYS